MKPWKRNCSLLVSNPFRVSNLFLFSVALISIFSCKNHPDNYSGWTTYGGNKEANHYSSLKQIDTSNVDKLQPAWIFHTGDADTANHSQIQCNPIIIDSTLYGTSPQMKLFALDARTGKPKWEFNPFDSLRGDKGSFFIMNNCRGVSFWKDGMGDSRIFYTVGSLLYCINAQTGLPQYSFGDSGKVDLRQGLDRDASTLFITATSPGIIYKDLIIMGSRVDEGPSAAPGHIRAWDVRSGRLKWIFHTIPYPGEPGHETWDDPNAWQRIGGANNWSGMCLDEKRGIVYVPTGSASFDFYGGKRTGNNLFADCLIALDGQSGKRIWHFQQIHHDVWDRDFPAPPTLLTVQSHGKKIDAVAQTTKTGFVFLFNRVTGEPLFPIDEKAVPTDTELKGEKLSPVQPIPALPKPFVRQLFPSEELNSLLPDTSFGIIKKRWESYRKDHMYAPPGSKGTIVLPGFDGGAEWGGPAVDPETGILYVNANEMAWVLTMVPQSIQPPKENYAEAGHRLYRQNCMNCHGSNREGSGNIPSIQNAKSKYNPDQLLGLINSGRRMMPAFRQLAEEDKMAILGFVLEQKGMQKIKFPPQPVDSFLSLPYGITGYNKFLSPEGLPAVKPPWGSLTAIDMNTGSHIWRVTLGDYPEFAAKGIHTGTENYGGPVVTAGGLLFIAATRDSKIRAYNKFSGKLLWEYDLPYPGFATPAVYSVGKRQYLVIACGGGKLGTLAGDAYLAFALPDEK